ncbi:MAG: flavodoxin family protein [Beijerinckiaceae bacterium]|jgi:NAD(P)H dehydrogenase (quinone)
MAKVAVVYHSGYCHTAKQAKAVEEGAGSVAGAEALLLPISAEGELAAGAWELLASADAILFGSPTYMGGASWQFKKFADASSKPWFGQVWKDKIAGGFTNSASMNGDKFNTITYFVTLAMQHSMVWVGTGLLPANAKANKHGDINYVAGFTGALATSPSDSSPDEFPNAGDLETAKLLGRRLAEFAVKLRG